MVRSQNTGPTLCPDRSAVRTPHKIMLVALEAASSAARSCLLSTPHDAETRRPIVADPDLGGPANNTRRSHALRSVHGRWYFAVWRRSYRAMAACNHVFARGDR